MRLHWPSPPTQSTIPPWVSRQWVFNGLGCRSCIAPIVLYSTALSSDSRDHSSQTSHALINAQLSNLQLAHALMYAHNPSAYPKETQHKSKNSELAHVQLVCGQLKCIVAKHIPHYTIPIGGASTSDAKPDWWCHPRRKCRGGVGDNLHTLAHAQFWQMGMWES